MRHWLIVATISMVFAAPDWAAAGESSAESESTILLAQARGRQNRPAPRRAQQARGAPPQQATQETPPAADPGDGQELRRGEKVEFDARLIQGQTAKAGAVFLFERVSSDLSSMVKERRSYRREIIEEVFPQETDR